MVQHHIVVVVIESRRTWRFLWSSTQSMLQNKACSCQKGCNSDKSCKCKKRGTACPIFCHPMHFCTNCKHQSKTQNIISISDVPYIFSLKVVNSPLNRRQNCSGVALTMNGSRKILKMENVCLITSFMLAKWYWRIHIPVFAVSSILFCSNFQHGTMWEGVYLNLTSKQESLDNSFHSRMFTINY